MIAYKAGLHTGIEERHIQFTLSESNYSIDDFNTKTRSAGLHQRNDWEAPNIKDVNLVIPDCYTFMTSKSLFIALGIPINYLEKVAQIKSTLLPGTYETFLDILPPLKLLSLSCKQTSKVKNEVTIMALYGSF